MKMPPTSQTPKNPIIDYLFNCSILCTSEVLNLAIHEPKRQEKRYIFIIRISNQDTMNVKKLSNL